MPPIPVSQITAKYKQALELQSKAQFEQALAIYSQILEVNPKIAEVHFQIGRIFFAGNKFEKSVFHFGLALQLKPNEPAIWQEYIPSLLCNADPDEVKKAAKTLKKTAMDKRVIITLQNKLQSSANGSIVPVGNLNKSALAAVQSAIVAREFTKANSLASTLFKQNPKSAVLAELLARTYLNLKDIEQARHYFKTATELDPTFFNAFNNYGHLELEQKNYSQAIKLLKAAVVNAPHSVSGLCNLADALSFNGQSGDAHAVINNARKLRLKGGKLDLLQAEMYVRTGEYDDAQKHYQTAIKREKPSSHLYFDIGDVFSTAGQLDRALEYYDLAQELDPDNPQIFYHQAVAHREAGHLDQALEKIQAAMAIEPSNAEFLFFYSNSKKFEEGDPAIDQMIELYKDDSIHPELHTNLGFGISKVLEDSKQYDRAFPFLKSANDSVAARYPYDVSEAKKESDELIAYFKNFKLSDYEGMGFAEARPIFICGMPRSGTTLTEQIISSHSQVTGAGEVGYTNKAILKTMRASGDTILGLNEIVPEQFEALGVNIWRYLTHHFPGNPYITDKSIMTYRRMGLLKAAMPNCKFIVVRRDPRDNLLSIYRNRFKEGTHLYAYDLEDLGAYYKQFVRIIDFWRDQMPDGFMEINYEDLIDDPETHARALVEYSGLDWEDQCLDFHKSKRQVKTLSVMQVRQPIYKSSVKAWQRYETELQPLFEAIK